MGHHSYKPRHCDTNLTLKVVLFFSVIVTILCIQWLFTRQINIEVISKFNWSAVFILILVKVLVVLVVIFRMVCKKKKVPCCHISNHAWNHGYGGYSRIYWVLILWMFVIFIYQNSEGTFKFHAVFVFVNLKNELIWIYFAKKLNYFTELISLDCNVYVCHSRFHE